MGWIRAGSGSGQRAAGTADEGRFPKAMWRLHHFALCPFSRKLRLLLSEKGVPYTLEPENPWALRDEYYLLNPAGRTPAMRHEDKDLVLADSRAIAEYLESVPPVRNDLESDKKRNWEE